MKNKFKLVTFLGIRPDIIRMHKLLELLDRGQSRHGYQHSYVHSGQHFDYRLDGVFYREMGIAPPKLNLHTGRTLKKTCKTNHVFQAGLLFQKTQRMLEHLHPDAVLYLGDTNTVLSAIVVAKANIPVIHIEGGGRSFDWRMPEEKNRLIADHLSDVIYCYLDRYRQLLLAEGVPEFRITTVGNIIVDAVSRILPLAEKSKVLRKMGVSEKEFALCTLHREENLDNRDVLAAKLEGLRDLSNTLPVVLPVMPRLKARMKAFRLGKILQGSGVISCEPQGFVDFLKLESTAHVIVTDSGTVQEEALILGVPCLVTRRSTERPETLAAGATILAEGGLCANAHRAMQLPRTWNRNVLNPAGGSPSQRIYGNLVARIQSGYFEKSRSFEMLQENRFVQEAYGLAQCALQQTASA